jgi:hypothetical protein
MRYLADYTLAPPVTKQFVMYFVERGHIESAWYYMEKDHVQAYGTPQQVRYLQYILSEPGEILLQFKEDNHVRLEPFRPVLN